MLTLILQLWYIISMNKLKSFTASNKKHTQNLGRLIEPLAKHFGIDVFWHNTIQEDGLYTSISNFQEPLENFYENNWYERAGQLVSPSMLRDGHFFLDLSGNFYKFWEETQSKHPFHHPMFVQRKEGSEKVHQFGFASKEFSYRIPSIYLNSFSMIEEFIKYYLKYYEEHISTIETDGINLINLKGIEGFYGANAENEDHITSRNCSFLKEIGTDSYLINSGFNLSKRQQQVLLGCVEGLTAAQTAKELGLSLRTVEHYLDAVKDKLGVFNKKELMIKGKVLKIAGLLTP